MYRQKGEYVLSKVKFAFLFMGEGYEPQTHYAVMETEFCSTTVVGVSDLCTAQQVAKRLWKEQGIQAIELCGAFMEKGARTIIEATEHQVAVGYVIHLPEQDALFQKVFGK